MFSDYQQYSLGSCELTDIAGRVATRVTGHYPHRNQFLIDAGFLATSHDGANKLPHGGSYGCFDNEPGLKYVNPQAMVTIVARWLDGLSFSILFVKNIQRFLP